MVLGKRPLTTWDFYHDEGNFDDTHIDRKSDFTLTL